MLQRNGLIAGMLVVLASMAVTAAAQPGPPGPGGGMRFGRGSSAVLLAMPEVQKELNLNDDQTKQITTLLRDAREKLRASFGQSNVQEMQNLSQEERQKRFDERRKMTEEVGKGIDKKIAGILDAKQAERLHQLQLQREGAMALNRPEVIKKLVLSQDQQAQIKKIQEDARPKNPPAFDSNQPAADRQAAFQKMREQFEKAQKDSLAVLNDDQMLDWTKMCGKTFLFPQRPGFGRGNRQGAPPNPQP